MAWSAWRRISAIALRTGLFGRVGIWSRTRNEEKKGEMGNFMNEGKVKYKSKTKKKWRLDGRTGVTYIR